MSWQAPPGDHSGGGAERYLITYADMITLLLVLFIILYATANQDLEKFKALSQSLSEGFGATVKTTAESVADEGTDAGTSPVLDTSGGGQSPVQMYPKDQVPIQIFAFAEQLTASGEGSMMSELEKIVQEAAQAAGAEMGGEAASIEVNYNERGLVISIQPDQILFDSGTANLKPGFRQIIDKLSPFLGQLPNRIEVHGHTDDRPINTAQFPSNWELSASRAGSVIRYLQAKGIPGERLAAAGYADTRPIAENSSSAGRSKNRRVEIVILRQAGESGPLGQATAQPAQHDAVPSPEPAIPETDSSVGQENPAEVPGNDNHGGGH